MNPVTGLYFVQELAQRVERENMITVARLEFDNNKWPQVPLKECDDPESEHFDPWKSKKQQFVKPA